MDEKQSIAAQPVQDRSPLTSSARRQHQIPTSPVRIGNTSVLPVSSVRDLDVYLDADVAMKSHVTAVTRSCFAALRRIRSVRRFYLDTP